MNDNWNYYNDPRVANTLASISVFMDDGEHSLPTKFEVCPTCEGRGVHVNPSIDCDGLTAEDLEDPDFRESYLSGVYDVVCYTCGGKRVVPVVDRDRCTADLLAAYDEQEQELLACEAEHRAELRWGC